MGTRAYWKDVVREIKKTMGRFISLLVIAALGAATVVGIQATSVDMRAIADKTYKKQNLYDIQIKSATGFNEDDIDALKNLANVNTVMPAYTYDVFVYAENKSRTVRTYSLPEELNKIKLLDGRLPQNGRECAVELGLLEYGKYKIGGGIELGLDNMYEYNYVFDNNEFTVVGVVSSPFYISFERGNTTLGDGKLNFYLYLCPETYKLPVYTDVYILMDGSHDIDNLTDEYNAKAEEWKDYIKKSFDSEWFYFTRKDGGVAFDSYYQDTLRLQKIGYVFPMIFFLVAVLVSLTTMSRMVEENRTQIGIYKALGYKPVKIIMKYLIYAFTAGITGGVIGVIAGSNIFPRVLADAYGYLYDMPPIETPVPVIPGITSVALSVGVVMLVTLFTCLNAMSGAPAELMRPKSPRGGKRVLIEKIPVIWNRFSFLGKVTARNIFRYKRRFVMTLIGVAGCSALLLTAFGLRDSIGEIGNLQYGKIAVYSSRAYIKDIETEKQREDLDSLLSGDYLYIHEESVTAGGFSVALIVPETPSDLEKFIKSYESGGVSITEKLARKMGVSAGDNFEMTAGNGKTYTVRATAVIENYILHYIYMSADIYFEIFGEEPLFNSILAISDNHSVFAETLLTDNNVRAVIGTVDLKENVNNSTDALQVVALVLIILANALAFVVLFNLTNINITERIRELATIKVLGFYDMELAMYIYRENGIVTVMGIILGLTGGIWLHRFVLTSVEIDLLMFPYIIKAQSYIFSVALSVIFALFVNLVMNYRLVKIDMVESLKNVE